MSTDAFFGTPLEAPKPTQNPEIPKNTALRELFRKVLVNFCLLLSEASQEPDGNCSEKLVQMNFFILGGFFRVDFPPVTPVRHPPYDSSRHLSPMLRETNTADRSPRADLPEKQAPTLDVQFSLLARGTQLMKDSA